MLEEISESAAEGRIAEIYAEIRSSCAVPYVSSLQRFLATQPDWLVWCWDALGPGFRDGWLPNAGWRAASGLRVPELAPVSATALRVWEVDSASLGVMVNICANFVRVSPTNLMFSGIARRLMLGARPAENVHLKSMAVPATLPTMPDLIAFDALSPEVKDLLTQLGTEVNGKPFVPALYRLFAPWPAFLAHLATVLSPLFDDEETTAACQRLTLAIEDEIDAVWSAITNPGVAPQPPEHPQTQALIAALDRYRITSPQMVVFASMIANALTQADE